MNSKHLQTSFAAKILVAIFIFVLLPQSLHARPKVGLALGGGGAKGGAHIGVIEILEREKIPIDYIAGTSIGSLIGGLYALGFSAQEVEDRMVATAWEEGYSDLIPREDLPYRLKQRDQFNVPLNIGHQNYQIKSPSGLLYGQRASMLLKEAFGNVSTFSSFDDLPIPFRAVATDLSSNSQVILDGGDLLLSVRVSSNVPGILAPVRLNGKLLVDGGMANNMPVDVVKAMGADIVIAIDIGDVLLSAKDLEDTLSIVGQLSSFLTVASTEKQVQQLNQQDLLIRPDISDLSTTDWSTFKAGIEEGRKAAEGMLDELKSLSIAPEDYDSYLSARNQRHVEFLESTQQPIKKITLENQSEVNSTLIMENLALTAGGITQPRQINEAIARGYSLDEFQRVDMVLEDSQAGRELVFTVEGKDWGPNFLEFGIGWETNFIDQSSTDLDLAHTATNLTSYGGEWRTQVELGSEPGLNTELYFPLSETRFSYARTMYSFESLDWGIENLSTLPITIEQHVHQVRLGFGLNYSRHGILEVGALAELGSLDNRHLLSKAISYDSYGSYIQLGFDNLNSASFPTQGNRLLLSLTQRDEDVDNVSLIGGGTSSLGADSLQLSFEWKGAISIDSHAFVGKANFTRMYTDHALESVSNTQLGGFLNLSGYNDRALTAPHKAFAALIYQYNLRGGMFRRTQLPFYLGASVEAGNVWGQEQKIDADDLIYGGSLYLGTDTIMGPVALGYGANDHGAESVYFYLGYEL